MRASIFPSIFYNIAIVFMIIVCFFPVGLYALADNDANISADNKPNQSSIPWKIAPVLDIQGSVNLLAGVSNNMPQQFNDTISALWTPIFVDASIYTSPNLSANIGLTNQIWNGNTLSLKTLGYNPQPGIMSSNSYAIPPMVLGFYKANIQYKTIVGQFTAGRYTKNWGLGAYWNDKADIYNMPTTGDGLHYQGNLNSLQGDFWFDNQNTDTGGLPENKLWQFSAGLQYIDQDLGAHATGINRNIGILLGKTYSGTLQNTTLTHSDLYAKFYTDRLYFGSELYGNIGNSASGSFSSLGGTSLATNGAMNQAYPIQQTLLYNQIGFLWQDSSLNSIQGIDSINFLPTDQTPFFHKTEGVFAIVQGDSNQYLNSSGQNTNTGTQKILGTTLNPNVTDGMLMFGNLNLPNAPITNTIFYDIKDSWEIPQIGNIQIVFLQGWLQKNTTNFGNTNTFLGTELDANYSYKTQYNLTFGGGLGLWNQGPAWLIQNNSQPLAVGATGSMEYSF
jgi:hypothetical protein